MADLDGINVVSFEQAVAAPYAACKLADAGARVIKVERPEGDFARGYDGLAKGHSAYFVWLNRGKESIALDLKNRGDADLARKLVAGADIVIQNMAPGALERLGLGLEAARRADPSLITCSISGYGEAGPWKDQKAYDLLIQAETGLSAITGGPQEPSRVGVSVCDIAAGMTAHGAIMQALFARERDPRREGRAISVSLFHALADWMNVPLMQQKYGGRAPGRPGLKHPTIVPYGAFDCGDGKVLLISIQNEREWLRLCAALGFEAIAAAPGFRNNTERLDNRAKVDALVGEAFRRYDRESLVERLAAARIAYGRLSSIGDLINHPQNRWIAVKSGDDEIRLLSPDAVVSGTGADGASVPGLDEHGASIRQEFAAD